MKTDHFSSVLFALLAVITLAVGVGCFGLWGFLAWFALWALILVNALGAAAACPMPKPDIDRKERKESFFRDPEPTLLGLSE